MEVKTKLGLGIKFPPKHDFNLHPKFEGGFVGLVFFGLFFLIPTWFIFGYTESIFVPTTQHDIRSKQKHASQQSRISKTVEVSIIPECHFLLWHTKEEETGKEN